MFPGDVPNPAPFYFQAPSFTPTAHLPTAPSLHRCLRRTSAGPTTRTEGDASPTVSEFTPHEGPGAKHQHHPAAQLTRAVPPLLTVGCSIVGPSLLSPPLFVQSLNQERIWEPGGPSPWVIGRASLAPFHLFFTPLSVTIPNHR